MSDRCGLAPRVERLEKRHIILLVVDVQLSVHLEALRGGCVSRLGTSGTNSCDHRIETSPPRVLLIWAAEAAGPLARSCSPDRTPPS